LKKEKTAEEENKESTIQFAAGRGKKKKALTPLGRGATQQNLSLRRKDEKRMEAIRLRLIKQGKGFLIKNWGQKKKPCGGFVRGRETYGERGDKKKKTGKPWYGKDKTQPTLDEYQKR